VVAVPKDGRNVSGEMEKKKEKKKKIHILFGFSVG
jgi:hypothetical protein